MCLTLAEKSLGLKVELKGVTSCVAPDLGISSKFAGAYKYLQCRNERSPKFSTMSIARQLFREFRPFFRMLDEPFYRRAPPGLLPSDAMHRLDRENLLADPFTGLNMMTSPAVDVTEQGDKYVLDADLPGVERENLEVRLGDGNQSITIEGKVTEKLSSGASEAGAQASGKSNNASEAEYTDGTCIRLTLPMLEVHDEMPASKSTSATKDNGATQISAERPYTRNMSFTRTVWLPRSVDPNNVTAKLQNGVLSVTLNKAAEQTGRVVEIK